MTRPLLKKPTVDPHVLSKYRLFSNLLSKVLEKAVARHLQDRLNQNNFSEKIQSSFCSAHSTETALKRVTNDHLLTAEDSSHSFILLDLSAAFGTVDHDILLTRLHCTIGLTDTAFSWFMSYRAYQTEYIALGLAKSKSNPNHIQSPVGSLRVQSLAPSSLFSTCCPLDKSVTMEFPSNAMLMTHSFMSKPHQQPHFHRCPHHHHRHTHHNSLSVWRRSSCGWSTTFSN